MDIMDIVEEFLSSHTAARFGRCTVNRKSTRIVEVRTDEHEFILTIGKDNWPKFPWIYATVGYIDHDHYSYHSEDDMEISSGMPTFNVVGHRHIKDVENPDFTDRVCGTLMEFLDEHEEWTNRRMRRINVDAASRMSDEDL